MRLLRPLGLVVGLVTALGVLLGRRLVSRSVRVGALVPPAPADLGVPLSTTPRQRLARRLLGAAGVGVLGVGGWKLVHAVSPAEYGWLVVWLVGAILLHDLLVAPLLVGLRAAAHRGLVSLPTLALVVVEGAFLVVGLLVLVVVPELWVQHLGPANVTVLPGPYGRRLVVTAAVVAVAALVAVTLVVRRTPRATP